METDVNAAHRLPDGPARLGRVSGRPRQQSACTRDSMATVDDVAVVDEFPGDVAAFVAALRRLPRRYSVVFLVVRLPGGYQGSLRKPLETPRPAL